MTDGINGYEIMQTFMPYPDFAETARCLDYRRLGKQRVECMQILGVLQGKTSGYARHPAVLMWQGHEGVLCTYATVMSIEWMRRGFVDGVAHHFTSTLGQFAPPPWLGDRRFHASHRSNLLRKDPNHYGQFGWKERHDLPYVWPTKEGMT